MEPLALGTRAQMQPDTTSSILRTRLGPQGAYTLCQIGTLQTCYRAQRGEPLCSVPLGTEEQVTKCFYSVTCLLAQQVEVLFSESMCWPNRGAHTQAHLLFPTQSLLPSQAGWCSAVPSPPCLQPPPLTVTFQIPSIQIWSLVLPATLLSSLLPGRLPFPLSGTPHSGC